MSMQLNLNTSNSSVVCLVALLVCSCAALAQPIPGGPRGEEAGESARPEPPIPSLPPLPANAPEPSSNLRNFDGIWYRDSSLEFQIRTDMFGNKLPFNAAGQKVRDRRLKSLQDGTPFINASSRCLPVGQPWQMSMGPFHVFQSQDGFDIQFQEYHGFFEIAMDSAKAPPPGYMGRSIGRWDGDTLVVAIDGFKDAFWIDLDGTPASKSAKLTMRIRKAKSDHWYMEVQYTLDDPTYYTRPWSWLRSFAWRPDMALFSEYNCELQVGAPEELYPGLIPEPQD